jgi:hypothetical protein
MKKGIPRPKDWMENPYIGKDGRDYHTYEALDAANVEFNRRMQLQTNLTNLLIRN